MIRVAEAESIILTQVKDFGTESISFEMAVGRVLAEDIMADRDLPPFNRATVDGIAISYNAFENGICSYFIKSIQAAGDNPVDTDKQDECIEIMTGAAVPATTDTVIRYEDITIKDGIALIVADTITKGSGIHIKGSDKKQHDIVAGANRVITPALIGIVASVGCTDVLVKKLPRIVIITTGDELVDVDGHPSPYQVRRSNNYTIQAALQQYNVHATMLHLPDNAAAITKHLQHCLDQYDVVLLSGGVSMGKFDHVPQVLEQLSVNKLFHKVQQRPGKPFWFGVRGSGVVVFAFPGNPVSVFMCLHRYFFPWLDASLGLAGKRQLYAVLGEDFTFLPQLQYFLQVKLRSNREGRLLAYPIQGNGSGDYANLHDADAFMELPLEQSNFNKGEVYPIWPFNLRLV